VSTYAQACSPPEAVRCPRPQFSSQPWFCAQRKVTRRLRCSRSFKLRLNTDKVHPCPSGIQTALSGARMASKRREGLR
jgi:hypothetical protein